MTEASSTGRMGRLANSRVHLRGGPPDDGGAQDGGGRPAPSATSKHASLFLKLKPGDRKAAMTMTED